MSLHFNGHFYCGGIDMCSLVEVGFRSLGWVVVVATATLSRNTKNGPRTNKAGYHQIDGKGPENISFIYFLGSSHCYCLLCIFRHFGFTLSVVVSSFHLIIVTCSFYPVI